MKKIIPFLAFFFFAFSTTFSQWTNISFPDLDVLNDIHFTDANTGFLCGYNFTYPGMESRIYRTANGGTTWTQVLGLIDSSQPSSQTYALKAIYFTSPSNGFVVGAVGGSYPIICKTTDAGLTWDTLTLTQNTGSIYNLFFPSPNVGYICGSLSGTVLMKTTDGGSTWFDISSSASSAMNGKFITDIHFLNDSIGYASTLGSSTDFAGIYQTFNGGASWVQIFSIGNNIGFRALQFISNTTGFAAATGGKIFKTSNGGNTWVPIPITSSDLDVWDVFFITSQLGYAASGRAADYSGAIYKTTDSGNTWVLDNSGNYVIANTYYSLTFSGGKGYACGSGGYSKNNNAPISTEEINSDFIINVYPNPVKNKMAIEVTCDDFQEGIKLIFNNVLGGTVKVYPLKEYHSTIILDNLTPGIYFYNLSNDQKSFITGKLIIE